MIYILLFIIPSCILAKPNVQSLDQRERFSLQLIPKENTIFEMGGYQNQEIHKPGQISNVKREQEQPLSIAEQEILLKWFNRRKALCLCKRHNQNPETGDDMVGKTNENAWRGKRSMVCDKCWTNQQKGAKAWRGRRKAKSGSAVKRKVEVLKIPDWLQKYNIL
uniref:Uncharacterized protein n=1 Tax=Clytia hemisphaerica TaxID=252671 RepID=A0A7M5V9C0_9CNID